jgi:plasmid rolling circle replication initiator protein Rep
MQFSMNTAHEDTYSPLTKCMLYNFYCCAVHFDNVQNSFHQHMHPLLNICVY